MKDRLFNFVPVFMILVIVFTSITNKVNLNESNIKNEILKAANTNEVIDTNLDLPILEDGYKKVDIFVDGSRLSFDKSNTITELDVIDSIMDNRNDNSDKVYLYFESLEYCINIIVYLLVLSMKMMNITLL